MASRRGAITYTKFEKVVFDDAITKGRQLAEIIGVSDKTIFKILHFQHQRKVDAENANASAKERNRIALRALLKVCFDILSHTPNSPDLARSGYYLFSKMKKRAEGWKIDHHWWSNFLKIKKKLFYEGILNYLKGLKNVSFLQENKLKRKINFFISKPYSWGSILIYQKYC